MGVLINDALQAGSHSSMGFPSGSASLAKRPFGAASGLTLTSIPADRSCSTMAIEIINAKIDHPFIPRIAEIVGIVRERREHRGASSLLLNRAFVVRYNLQNPQMLGVPLVQRAQIFGPKKHPTNSSYGFHGHLLIRIQDARDDQRLIWHHGRIRSRQRAGEGTGSGEAGVGF